MLAHTSTDYANAPAVRVFPPIAADFGGAESVRRTARFAFVKMPGRETPVKIPLSKLPSPAKWSAFTLADAALVAINLLPA